MKLDLVVIFFKTLIYLSHLNFLMFHNGSQLNYPSPWKKHKLPTLTPKPGFKCKFMDIFFSGTAFNYKDDLKVWNAYRIVFRKCIMKSCALRKNFQQFSLFFTIKLVLKDNLHLFLNGLSVITPELMPSLLLIALKFCL